MASLSACPPWLLADWAHLFERHRQGTLPHALLFNGQHGVGKRPFARFVAESLLCRSPTREHGGCGECDACHQLVADAHPDYRHLMPEAGNDEAVLKVDEIRDLVSWLQLTAGQGSYRIALVEGADHMNRSAANSFLKTLEEPGNGAVLILVADRPASLPATIRSRCQQINLRVREADVANDWLARQGAGGQSALHYTGRTAPFALLEQLDETRREQARAVATCWVQLFGGQSSAAQLADSLRDIPTRRCLERFAHWAALAARWHRIGAVGLDPATEKLVSAVAPRLAIANWFTVYDQLQRLHRADSASFKTQAVLEGLFADIRLTLSV